MGSQSGPDFLSKTITVTTTGTILVLCLTFPQSRVEGASFPLGSGQYSFCPFGYTANTWQAALSRNTPDKCELYQCYFDKHCVSHFGPYTWCGFEHGSEWLGCKCTPDAELDPTGQFCVPRSIHDHHGSHNPSSSGSVPIQRYYETTGKPSAAKPVAIPLAMILLFCLALFGCGAYSIEQRHRRQDQELLEQKERKRLRRLRQNLSQNTSVESQNPPGSEPEIMVISLNSEPSDANQAALDDLILVPLDSEPTNPVNPEDQPVPADPPPSYAEALGKQEPPEPETNTGSNEPSTGASAAPASGETLTRSPPPSYYSLSPSSDVWV